MLQRATKCNFHYLVSKRIAPECEFNRSIYKTEDEAKAVEENVLLPTLLHSISTDEYYTLKTYQWSLSIMSTCRLIIQA